MRQARRRARLCANTAIASPKARGRPASRRTSSTVDVLALRHPLQWDGDDGGAMAKKDPASKQSAGALVFTINLERAFGDLLMQLQHIHGQPARDAGKKDVDALLAVARFLDRMGPIHLAPYADHFAMLAQELEDARIPAGRSDLTMVWLARAHVALAVETLLQHRDYPSRKDAAEEVANRRPELKPLITERGAHRGSDLEKTIVFWCENLRSGKVKNRAATKVYSVGLDKLKAWALNRNRAQIEAEADKLLDRAIALI
jgi:hypothetical protein